MKKKKKRITGVNDQMAGYFGLEMYCPKARS